MCNFDSIHSSHSNVDSHQSVYSVEISGLCYGVEEKTVNTLVDINFPSQIIVIDFHWK
jgi:hypothetical protein